MRAKLAYNFSIAALLFSMAACSQARRGVSNNGPTEELWSTMELCQNLRGAKYTGCFRITPNVSENLVYIEVGSLPWNAGDFVPYRVLARPHGKSNFYLLLDNIMVDVGGVVEVPAGNLNAITDYEEWRIETTQVLSPYNGIDLVNAAAGRGEPLAQMVLIWPELSSLNYTGPRPNANYSN